MSVSLLLLNLAGGSLILLLLYFLFQKQSISRQRYRELRQLDFLINSAHDAIILLDENFHIIFWNKGAEALYGYTAVEMRGKESFHLLPERLHDQEKDTVKKIRTADISLPIRKSLQFTGKRKNGEEFPSEVSLSTFQIEGKQYYCGIVRDSTEHQLMEAALEKSEKRFRLLIENSSDLIITIDQTGALRYLSPSVMRMLGYHPEEVQGKNIQEFIHPDDRSSALIELTSALQNPATLHSATCRCLHRNGSWRIMQAAGQATHDESGELVLIINARDITAQQQAEEARKESEERFKALAQSASDPIICIDKQGAILFWNSAAELTFGYSAEEIMGTSITLLMPERYHDYYTGGMERVMSSGIFDIGKIAFEFVGRNKGGAEFPAELSFATWESRGDIFFSCIVRDISERKQAEEALQKEKEYTRTIIETADALIIALDTEDKVILFNRLAEELTGYSRDEVLGKDLLAVIPIRMDKDAFAKMTQEIMEGGSVSPYHLFITNKAGEEKTIFTRGRQLKDKDGKVIGVLEIGVDVTEQRRMETKLLQAEKLRGLGEMAGGVAHDFNNVLAAILGRAQLLKLHLDEFPGAERRKSYQELKQGLEVIERAAADGAETVRRVQEFARIRPDDKDMAAVNLNEVIEHAIEFTRPRWKDEAELKGIQYVIEKQLSPVPAILGSAAELREVLTNLINNAMDAMPDGGTISIKTFPEKTQVCMLVGDSGTGMPKHLMERIFDPFFTTKGPQSTGLGMSVSYGIVTRHQGAISVDSEEGKGTVFTIKFPVREIEKQETEVTPETGGDMQKAAILIIEDEEDVRTLLQDILTMQGHAVVVAQDGREGVALFKTGAFDLVFTDLGMPGMSGWEVAKVIRAIDLQVSIAIITGWDIHMDKEALEESGVNRIIQKPFTVDVIVRLVREALAIKKAKSFDS